MKKLSNSWEMPLAPFLPYLQWGEMTVGQTDTWIISRHNHASFELHIVMEGESTLRVNDRAVSLHTWQGIVLAPGVFHAPAKTSPKFLRFSLLFFPKDSLSDYLPPKNGYLIFDTTEPIRYFCRAIINEVKQRDGLLHEELLSGQFSQLMIHVLRAIGESQKTSREGCQDTKLIDEMAIIDRFFVITPPKMRTKENLADLLHCSQRQVLRKLRTLYGISFQKKQLLSRLDTAQYLLLTTDQSMEEISHTVGYSDSAAFYRAFRLYTDTTPLKYRKSGGDRQKYKANAPSAVE